MRRRKRRKVRKDRASGVRQGWKQKRRRREAIEERRAEVTDIETTGTGTVTGTAEMVGTTEKGSEEVTIAARAEIAGTGIDETETDGMVSVATGSTGGMTAGTVTGGTTTETGVTATATGETIAGMGTGGTTGPTVAVAHGVVPQGELMDSVGHPVAEMTGAMTTVPILLMEGHTLALLCGANTHEMTVAETGTGGMAATIGTDATGATTTGVKIVTGVVTVGTAVEVGEVTDAPLAPVMIGTEDGKEQKLRRRMGRSQKPRKVLSLKEAKARAKQELLPQQLNPLQTLPPRWWRWWRS